MADRIGHVAFYVNDIEGTADFYSRVFGYREAFRMRRDDGSLGGVYLYITDFQFLEFFQASSASEGSAGTIGAAGGVAGYAHFCVQVPVLEDAYKKAVAEGAPIDAEIRTGLSKCRMFWTHDPDGNKIEVMELPPESLQAQANERLRRS